MGGSLGMALKSKGLSSRVIGWDVSRDKLDEAIRAGAIDTGTFNREEALEDTEVLVFATPVGATSALAADWFPLVPSQCLVTELGSVKGDIVESLTRLAGIRCYFVGSHPICGSEKSGVQGARSDLFENKLCLLTPVERTRKQALSRAQAFWQALGMKVVSLAPALHDQVMACVSHLPHLLAVSLVNEVGDRKLLQYAGSGFLDMTRIAAADPGLWVEIIFLNEENVSLELERWRKHLEKILKMLQSKDAGALKEWFRKAQRRRLNLGQAGEKNPSLRRRR